MQPNLLLGLAQRGIERRRVDRIDLAAGKRDLPGMIVEMGGALGQQHRRFVVLDDADQHCGGPDRPLFGDDPQHAIGALVAAWWNDAGVVQPRGTSKVRRALARSKNSADVMSEAGSRFNNGSVAVTSLPCFASAVADPAVNDPSANNQSFKESDMFRRIRHGKKRAGRCHAETWRGHRPFVHPPIQPGHSRAPASLSPRDCCGHADMA